MHGLLASAEQRRTLRGCRVGRVCSRCPCAGVSVCTREPRPGRRAGQLTQPRVGGPGSVGWAMQTAPVRAPVPSLSKPGHPILVSTH